MCCINALYYTTMPRTIKQQMRTQWFEEAAICAHGHCTTTKIETKLELIAFESVGGATPSSEKGGAYSIGGMYSISCMAVIVWPHWGERGRGGRV